MAWLWDWQWGSGLIFGLSLSCASTVVLLKALETRAVLESMNGRIAVGWLVVEDLATVLVLVLLPPLAGILAADRRAMLPPRPTATPLWTTIGLTHAAGRRLYRAGCWWRGRRVLPWFLWLVARTGSRELFTLSVIAAAIGIAYGAAQLFSVSFALGAFFAGMVMRESEFSHRAAQRIAAALRDAFSVLFFVSVGMLFKPTILIEQPLHVLGTVAIIILGKSVAAFALVLAFRYPLNTALTVSASPRADRRVLVHPGRARALAWAAARRRHEPGAGRRANLDRAEPRVVRDQRAAAPLDPQALGTGPSPGTARRPLRRTADEHRAQVSGGTGCADRLRPCGAAHCQCAAVARHSVRGRGARTGSWSRTCATAALRRCPAMPPNRRY
ncbi:cation:proton antiporter domain-containing protein [Cupriavidus basilensis]